MLLKIKTLSRRGAILGSVTVALGLMTPAQAQSVPQSPMQSAATLSETQGHSHDTAVERRVKSCAAPCRHRPSGMR